MKVVACLGNPGSEYSGTRHNVGWWLADRLVRVWGLGRFRREGNAGVASGKAEGARVEVVKPLTYMNRSGAALSRLRRVRGFDPTRDLLVVVDDVSLEPGRARFRASGSPGGHNGLKSVEAALGTRDYPRLRIGVGEKPSGMDLADWVLDRPSREDRDAIMQIFPDLVEGVELWITEGIDAAMRRCNGL